MARTRVHVPTDELQDAITQLEAQRPFGSPQKLYEAIAQTPWARGLGLSAVMIYLRVKEVNSDPSNPVITMKVKPVRKTGPRRTKGAVFDGIDLLMGTFHDYGIEITNVEQLISSSRKSSQENKAIFLAWAALRDKLGIPKPIKKTAPPVRTGEVQAIESTESSIVAEPVAETVYNGEFPGPVDHSGAEGAVHPIEEMPDGAYVTLPETRDTTLTVEPVVELAEGSPVESELPAGDYIPVAVPTPIQMTQVRPVSSRPVPVRSAMPPRPMPMSPY